MISRDELLAAYHTSYEAVLCLFEDLGKQIAEKDKRIQELEDQVRLLQHRLHQNSQNSHKPPSQDREAKPKPKSLRPESDRPVGGQQGHHGHTLRQVGKPDHVTLHLPNECAHCHRPLDDVEPCGWERRQVFDLPPVRLEVTEHQAARKICPNCHTLNEASFPAGLNAPSQYGPRFCGLIVYLRQYQLLPYDRIRQLVEDIFGQNISTGTLENINRECFDSLQPVEDGIRQALRSVKILHCDETGTSVDGKAHWLHVASTAMYTIYLIHPKRGKDATDAMDILPHFQGTAIHDCWATYFRYSIAHGLCNAHLQRELVAVAELTGQIWPEELIAFFKEAHRITEMAKATGTTSLPEEQRESLRQTYRQLVARGKNENPVIDVPVEPVVSLPSRFEFLRDTTNPKRTKQTKAQNLLDRLEKHEDAVLAFVDDLRVPFTNNQAEHDIRMTKVQHKISGGFRSSEGAAMFCRIRGYISTAQKHGMKILEALQSVFMGKVAFIPRAS